MIKARYIIESISIIILNERNVVNTDEVDDFIDRLLRQNNARDSKVKHWLQTTFRKYLINDYSSVGLATVDFLKTRPEYQKAWVDQALERGEEIYKVYLGGGLPQSINHILDYLADVLNPPEEFPTNLKVRDLTRLSVLDALNKSNEWTEWLQKRKVEGDADEGEEKIVDLGGFKVVKVISAAALDREGKLMQHCAGSYAADVAEGDAEIYSLRDSDNKPHVTFEVDPRKKELVQVKGKQNNPPVERYRLLSLDFLEYGLRKGFITDFYEGELEEMLRIVFHKGKLYLDDELPDDYLATEDLKDMYFRNGRPQYEDVKAALDRGADPCYYASYSDMAVVVEIKRGNEKMLDLLLSYGVKDDIIRVFLSDVIESSRHTKMLEVIKKHMDRAGWDSMIRGSRGQDAAIDAIWSGKINILKFLLDNSVDPNEGDSVGTTLLMVSVMSFLKTGQNKLEIIKTLIDGGADPDQENKKGQSSRYLATNLPRVLAIFDR